MIFVAKGSYYPLSDSMHLLTRSRNPAQRFFDCFGTSMGLHSIQKYNNGLGWCLFNASYKSRFMSWSHDKWVYLPQKSHGRLSSSPTCIEHVVHTSPTWIGVFLPCFLAEFSSAWDTDLVLLEESFLSMDAILQISCSGFVQKMCRTECWQIGACKVLNEEQNHMYIWMAVVGDRNLEPVNMCTQILLSLTY